MTERILFVDDMPDMGALVVDMLQLEGFAVDWCGSGAEASARLASNRYGVLVTDLCLGGPLDGETLARRAHAEGRPTLVVSGDADAVERLRASGFEAVLKPVDIGDLVSWLRRDGRKTPTAANG